MLGHRSTLYGTACKTDGMMYKTLLTDGNTPPRGCCPGTGKPSPTAQQKDMRGCPETRLHGLRAMKQSTLCQPNHKAAPPSISWRSQPCTPSRLAAVGQQKR